MDYNEVRIRNLAAEQKEILTFFLAEEGFESFADDGNDLLAYVPADQFNSDRIAELVKAHGGEATSVLIPDQNWNAEWEKNFSAVTIAGRCHIRAPFHPEKKDTGYEIVIMPKMSFGTAHHETTAGMITLMMDLELKGKRVLDMGCGTGILAILAEMKGAEEIIAIDNDRWAYENALENAERNNCRRITVKEGGKEEISGTFDVIIANINRNILLDQISTYAAASVQGSVLLMSGFYEEDLAAIREAAKENGFHYDRHISENRWVAAVFSR